MASTTIRGFGLVILVVLFAVGGCDCSDDDGPMGTADAGTRADSSTDAAVLPDTGPLPDTGVSVTCGNSMVEAMRGEECDDGNDSDDDMCLTTCRFACGDGVVNAIERCDTGIAAGETGACPADCDDGDACTTDSINGTGCEAECVHGDITMPADGDACCPAGADSTTDADCPVTCGNGVIEAGESCETTIAAGMPGACPTTCDDGAPCTTDTLENGGTCTAACTTTDITMPIAGDGCCPAGATPTTDADCTGCGDGAVGAGETCDTGIATGMGACPTSCDDGMPCTRDTLSGAGTCTAACSSMPITMPAPGDMCCPPGATIMTDTDCAARCGDRVVTAPEECDDGNTTSGDGCSMTCTRESVTTGFRLTDLDIRDPHILARVPLFGCQDLTNGAPLGMDGINQIIQNAILNDDDMDGLLELSILQAFRPLEQRAGMMTASDLTRPDCTAPEASTMCTLPAMAARTPAPVTNMGMGMVCLPTVAGTTRATYTPAIAVPTAPAGGTCYVATVGALTIDLGGLPITLTDAMVGGEWSGSPATQILDGLLRGFLSETDANFIYIPDGTTGIGAIDCQPLSMLLPGGNPPPFAAGDPQPPMGCAMRAVGSDPGANCSSNDDRDTGPGGVRGWFFYLNFRARVVPYTEM